MPVEDGEWIDAPSDSEEVLLRPEAFGPESVEQDSAQIPTEPPVEVEQEEAPSEVPDEEPVPEFDPRVHEDFDGLMYLGKLTDEFTWLGHKFLIRTLRTGELIEVGMLHKPYAQSEADAKAYQAAVVAACVVTVDGRPPPLPITNEASDTELRNKFEFVLRSWYPPLLDAIFERWLLLEARVDQVIEAMAKASGQTQ